MALKGSGLRRGLDALFQDNSFEEDDNRETGNNIISLQLSLIDTNPNQPRKQFDAGALAELAESIKTNGLLQPIIVRKKGGRYEIVAGERRYRAARLAGLKEINVIVKEFDDISVKKIALVENLQREDLNPYEEAAAINELMKDYSLTQEEIAAQIGKSRSAIANSVRLLDLPEEAAEMLKSGKLTSGHCKVLLGVKDEEQLIKLARQIAETDMSVRETEAAVIKINKEKPVKEVKAPKIRVNYAEELGRRFTEKTGRQCKIKDGRKEKYIRIEFRDEEDLEDIIRKVAGEGVLDSD